MKVLQIMNTFVVESDRGDSYTIVEIFCEHFFFARWNSPSHAKDLLPGGPLYLGKTFEEAVATLKKNEDSPIVMSTRGNYP